MFWKTIVFWSEVYANISELTRDSRYSWRITGITFTSPISRACFSLCQRCLAVNDLLTEGIFPAGIALIDKLVKAAIFDDAVGYGEAEGKGIHTGE